MRFSSGLIVASALTIASAESVGPFRRSNVSRAASFPIPASKGSVTYSAAEVITGSFDGGLKTYGRGISCTGQAEGDNSDAVFMVSTTRPIAGDIC